jgi:hypothetical protein
MLNLRLILRLQLIEEKSRQDGDAIGKIENIGYRNPSLGLTTKVRACQGADKE